MDNGVITEYDSGFDEYLVMNRSVGVRKNKNKVKTPAPKEKLRIQPEKPVLTEDLIIEAETQLIKVNTAIESDLSNFDYQKINELSEKKNQLEERIDLLYDEWIKNNYST